MSYSALWRCGWDCQGFASQVFISELGHVKAIEFL